MSWARIKRKQADDADQVAAVASGIGEYGIANACYRLAGLLRREAGETEERERAEPLDSELAILHNGSTQADGGTAHEQDTTAAPAGPDPRQHQRPAVTLPR